MNVIERTLRLWPLEPLLDHVGAATVREAAGALGVDKRQVYRWRADGGLSDRVADRAAVAAGTHPALVWPDWWTR